MFYDRFNSNLVLQAQRQNGITQQEYIIPNPTFFVNNIPSQSQLATLTASCSQTQTTPACPVPTVYQIAPNLHAPVTMQTAISVERQISKVMNATITYVNARGVHQLLTNNVNAPEINGVPHPRALGPWAFSKTSISINPKESSSRTN